LIRSSFDDLRVDLLRISAGNREIGYLYNFVSDGWVMAYQSGLTSAPDNRWKPGLVSHCAAITFALDRGDWRYDFLAGPARYKASQGNETIPMESIVAFAPKWHLTVEDTARRLRAGWRERAGSA
jgi:CelD/BcsL family acetyltransferase involved in cellulose biosynthesis